MVQKPHREKFFDHEKDRRAKLLTKITAVILAIITVLCVINMIMQPEYTFRRVIMLLCLGTLSIAVIFLSNKGYSYISSIFYISFLIIIIFAFSYTGGGIKAHGIKLLPVVVLLAGLTLGKKEIWIFGIITVAGIFVMLFAHSHNLIPVTEPIGQTLSIYALNIITSIILLCCLVNLTVEELRKALKASGEEIVLRKKSEALLKAKNDKLTEIAFLQSHIVRRPVANVLGIINILKTNKPDDPENECLILSLETAALELDIAIHEIEKNTGRLEAE